MSDGAILPIKVLVTHDQQEYSVDETQDRRDEGPAEEQIQNARADPAQGRSKGSRRTRTPQRCFIVHGFVAAKAL